MLGLCYISVYSRTPPIIVSAGRTASRSMTSQSAQSLDSARALIEDGLLEDALELLNGLIERDWMNAEAFNLRGVVYHRKKEDRCAIEDFDRALGTDFRFAEAHFNRGWSYYCLGDYYQAMTDFTAAIALAPDWEHAYKTRGMAHSKLGRHQDAISDLSRAIELDPSNGFAFSERALAFEDCGDIDAAIADLRQAIEIFYRDGHERLAPPLEQMLAKLESQEKLH